MRQTRYRAARVATLPLLLLGGCYRTVYRNAVPARLAPEVKTVYVSGGAPGLPEALTKQCRKLGDPVKWTAGEPPAVMDSSAGFALAAMRLSGNADGAVHKLSGSLQDQTNGVGSSFSYALPDAGTSVDLRSLSRALAQDACGLGRAAVPAPVADALTQKYGASFIGLKFGDGLEQVEKLYGPMPNDGAQDGYYMAGDGALYVQVDTATVEQKVLALIVTDLPGKAGPKGAALVRSKGQDEPLLNYLGQELSRIRKEYGPGACPTCSRDYAEYASPTGAVTVHFKADSGGRCTHIGVFWDYSSGRP